MAQLNNPVADITQNLPYFPQRVIQTDQAGNAFASQDLTLYSGTFTSSPTVVNQTNYTGRGVIVTLNVTAISGTTPSITLTIQGVDAAGNAYTLLAGAAVTATTATPLTYTVYPGAPATANVSANSPLPHTWNVKAAIAGTTPSVTCTVCASVIL